MRGLRLLVLAAMIVVVGVAAGSVATAHVPTMTKARPAAGEEVQVEHAPYAKWCKHHDGWVLDHHANFVRQETRRSGHYHDVVWKHWPLGASRSWLAVYKCKR